MLWMQEILSTQQCTNNTTLSNQQTHKRSSTFNLLSKFGKLKVMVPSPPQLLIKGGYYSRGHKATDTELTYAPVSHAYGHCHKLQFNV